MLFDKVVFQVECFTLVLDHKEVYFISFFQHFLFPERIRREILAQSLLQVLCFPYIQNSVFPVFEEVDSGIGRYLGDVCGEHGEVVREAGKNSSFPGVSSILTYENIFRSMYGGIYEGYGLDRYSNIVIYGCLVNL